MQLVWRNDNELGLLLKGIYLKCQTENRFDFDQMVDRIYPTELQLNEANSSDTEAPFLDLNLCISNVTVVAYSFHLNL